jgi:hypothetical protein
MTAPFNSRDALANSSCDFIGTEAQRTQTVAKGEEMGLHALIAARGSARGLHRRTISITIHLNGVIGLLGLSFFF